jgi:hypothetical protein
LCRAMAADSSCGAEGSDAHDAVLVRARQRGLSAQDRVSVLRRQLVRPERPLRDDGVLQLRRPRLRERAALRFFGGLARRPVHVGRWRWRRRRRARAKTLTNGAATTDRRY